MTVVSCVANTCLEVAFSDGLSNASVRRLIRCVQSNRKKSSEER